MSGGCRATASRSRPGIVGRPRSIAAAVLALTFGCLAAWSFVATAAEVSYTTARPPWQAPSIWPDRVIATLAEDPQTSFSVTWRTDATVTRPVAQIAPASADARFDLAATSFRAQTSPMPLDHFEADEVRFAVPENHGLAAVHYHSITFRDLAPGTAYAWRVRGAAGAWTPWRHLRTAPSSGPVRVLYFGDAQRGIRSHVTRLFDAARAAAPDAHFAIHGGDLVNTANHDREWAEWHEALGSLHHVIPALPVPGNHDYVNLTKLTGDEGDAKLFVARRTVTPLWRAQFTLPVEEGVPPDLAETVYDVRYSPDLHVFALDSSGVAWLEQLDWLERALQASDARWRVLVMHHPIYSHVGGREHPAHAERRRALVELLRAQDVDLVLAGHRHTYQRAEMGEGVARFQVGDARDVRTAFLVTAASAARGRTKVEGWARYGEEQGGRFALVRHADNTPLFAILDVDGERLAVRTLDAMGEVYDAFELFEAADGRKRIVDGPEALGPVRDYSNTGPYRDWDDIAP